jgi:hypothetical protein
MNDSRSFLFSYPFISLLLIAVILPYASGVIPTVNFTSERIEVHVYPDEIVVEGFYTYENPFPFPVIQGFTIPFPVDEAHPHPIEVNVERMTPTHEMFKLRRLLGKTSFEAYFSAHGQSEVHVFYRQKVKNSKATYILTTTKPWGKPLEKGVYLLYSHGTVIETSNYPLDLTGKTPGFCRTDFMPVQDWQFTWRNNEQ